MLLQRGLKTLAVRIRHQNQSALQLAQFLAAQPAVAVGLEATEDLVEDFRQALAALG